MSLCVLSTCLRQSEIDVLFTLEAFTISLDLKVTGSNALLASLSLGALCSGGGRYHRTTWVWPGVLVTDGTDAQETAGIRVNMIVQISYISVSGEDGLEL